LRKDVPGPSKTEMQVGSCYLAIDSEFLTSSNLIEHEIMANVRAKLSNDNSEIYMMKVTIRRMLL